MRREIYYLIWLFHTLAAMLTTATCSIRAVGAIRALIWHGDVAEAMWWNTSRSRMVIFVIAALLACLAGRPTCSASSIPPRLARGHR